MIWREKGVRDDSYMCFFDSPDSFKEYFFYMVSCGFFHCNGSYDVSNEGTRPPLLFYITSGTLHLEYEDKQYSAASGDIVLINCYRKQRYYCTDEAEFLFFHFDGKAAPSLTDHLIAQNECPIFRTENNNEIYHSIKEPIMKLCYQEQATDAALSTLVYSSLCLLHTGDTLDHTPVKARVAASTTEKAIEFIKSHIHENLTLQDIADEVGLNPYYFSHLFKKEVGYSPIEYVSITKINYAKLMLRTTNTTNAEIADLLGYSSESSFINAFKLRRGMSPYRYRKLVGQRQKDGEK